MAFEIIKPKNEPIDYQNLPEAFVANGKTVEGDRCVTIKTANGGIGPITLVKLEKLYAFLGQVIEAENNYLEGVTSPTKDKVPRPAASEASKTLWADVDALLLAGKISTRTLLARKEYRDKHGD